MKRVAQVKPGDRIVIARVFGAGLAGVVCAPAKLQLGDEVRVMFDNEPGRRYATKAAALDHEAIPKKCPAPSVRGGGQQGAEEA